MLKILYLMFLISYLFCFPMVEGNINAPIVVLHGVASSAPNMNDFSVWLEKVFTTKVFNIELGNGFKTSLYSPLTEQLNELCSTIYAIDELKDGFNFIGMSQGGLLARGYTEQCNKYRVINLITMVSPHGGVIEDINIDMYSPFAQKHLSLAGYWRDPKKIDTYLDTCSYLPIINNEKITLISELQLKNIKSLKNFILIWSENDDVVDPPESGKFSFYDDNYNIIDIKETVIYKKDLLGLKYLDEKNAFHIHETNCTHVQHRDTRCFPQLYTIFNRYL
jgi:palmitoyl-protein thioesterase